MIQKRAPLDDKLNVFPLPAGIRETRDIKIRMSDGVLLSANLYRPESDTPAPVVLSSTRYGKDVAPVDYLKAFSDMRSIADTKHGGLRDKS